MKNTLRRYNYALTADERVRLALAAMARDDDAELERLQKTCPQYLYRMTDVEFVNRFDASRGVAFDFMVAWLWAYARHIEVHWLMASHTQAVRRGLTSVTKAELDDLLIRRSAALKGVYVGYRRFCDAARLDWRALLVWWPPILDEIERVREMLEDETIGTSAEMAAAVYRILASGWPVPLDPTIDDTAPG